MSNELRVRIIIIEDRVADGVIIPKLCHGNRIIEIVTGKEERLDCDALITENRDLKLGVTTADCAPICFGDGERIGIAHVGWRGLCLGLVEKMLLRFDTASLKIFVGPHLHSFEIQKDFCYDAISAKFGEEFITHHDEKMIFNFKEAIASGLPESAMFDTRSTGLDPTLPSHRRNRTSTRMVTVVQFKNNSEIG